MKVIAIDNFVAKKEKLRVGKNTPWNKKSK
jgi:hypothetical protein